MEGVPRVPMICFPLKRSADVPDFKSKIKMFISQHYNEDADSYNQEISNFEALRAGAIHVSRDFTGCATLKKYFCQLNFLKSRFPFQEGSPIATSFSWYDAYSDSVHGWKDLDFEMACILYNIGALHSKLGSKDPRITADGMKNSCTHFQCAAWAFQHLKNDYHKYFSPDLSSDVLSVLTNICLAQAQECILEKSLIDNRKSAITAKVSLQIVEYYQQSLKTVDVILKKSSGGHSEKFLKAVKKWRELIEAKAYYYGCLSYLYRGLHAEEQSKFGERITFFKAGAEKLNEAIKCAKSMDKSGPVSILETLNFTSDVIGTKVTSSEKENEFVYHEKVPELVSVESDFKGVSLVKGIPFKSDDPEISGPDIFSRLVPMEAHEASSLYSEEKAKVLRLYSAKMEEKNEALERFLLAMQLDQLDIHAEESNVPQELVDCCAALSVNPEAVKKLANLMSKLSGMFHDVEHNLNEIDGLLKVENEQEKEYQEIVGKRPPNNLITELSREVKKYQHAHTVASESNQTLHEAMRVHVVNLQVLMKPFPEVLKSIPSISNIEDKDEAAITEMKRLRSKVEEMKTQREMLANQLRESILNDDITKSIVVKQDQDRETFFQEELKKHEKITQLLDQNMIAQDNILRAVTEANAAYATTRKATEEMIMKRNKVIQTLVGSYDAYNELLTKCTQGVEFYTKLDSNVAKLLQRVRSACKVQEEERKERTNSILKKTQNVPVSETSASFSYHGMNASHGNATGYSNYSTDLSARQESMDNAAIQQQYEKNMALQQQYEKNMALQQEYEKLTKLQQQLSKDSSLNYPANYSTPQQQYTSQNTNTVQNFTPQATVPSQYMMGSSATPYYGSTTMPPVTSTQQFSQDMSARAYPSTTSAGQQYMPNSGSSANSYDTSSTSTQPYLSNALPPQSTFVTNSTNMQIYNPSVSPASDQTSNVPPQMYSAPQYPSPAADPTMLNQFNQYSYNPLLQQYSQQYAQSTQNVQQPQYGNYPILNQQCTNISDSQASYGQAVVNQYGNNLSTQAPYGQQQTSNAPAEQAMQQSQQYAVHHNVTPQQQQPVYAQSKLPESGNMYMTNTSYSNQSGTNNEWAYNSTVNSTSFPTNYSYGTDVSYTNYYNQATNSASSYQVPYAQQQQNPQQQHQQSQPQLQQQNQQQHPQSQPELQQQNQPQLQQQNQPQLQQQSQQQQYHQGNYATQDNVYAKQQNVNQPSSVMSSGNQGPPNKQARGSPAPLANSAKINPGITSNVDLLSGVDLSLPQQPLQPLPTTFAAIDPAANERGATTIPSLLSHQMQQGLPKSLETSIPSPPADAPSDHLTENQLHNLQLKKPSENRKSVVDYLSDPSALEKFTKDVENLQHTFEGFYKKSLNGPTNLDMKWKEVLDIQNSASIKMNISVARCYPMKNRFPDILPHDQTRVPLPCTKDDYINASFVRDISPSSIPFIATQAPLPVTFSDFWHMVWHHYVELIVCLASDIDLKEHIYWPLERGKDVCFGPLNISLQSKNVKPTYVERIFCVTHRDLKQTRVTVHLQYKGWSGTSFPDSPGPFLNFINDVHGFFLQQRSLTRPIVTHCMSGVGKTGVFIILSSAIREIQNGKSFPDLTSCAGISSQQRKGIINDKEYLRFAYQCLLYYCQDMLMKRGILSARSTFDEKPKSSHTRHPSQDFLTEAIKQIVTTEGDRDEGDVVEKDVICTSLPCTPSHRNKNDQEMIPSPRARIFSDVPASLMDVEVSTFHRFSPIDNSIDPKRSNFESRKGALTKKPDITTDPLNTLDPLWTMKK